MKRFILRITVALLTFVVGNGIFFAWEQISPWKSSRQTTELSLVFMTSSTVVRVREQPNAKVYITNNGKDTVTLVHPGDGSEAGWRTPIAHWSVVRVDSTDHTNAEWRFRICGNIQPLRWRDVFTLAPGETKEIRRSGPYFWKPGTYRVKFYYANRPSTEWKGRVMGMHNPFAMWRVKRSTEGEAISNEITFTVNE